MTNSKKITRADYMNNSTELHHDYYSQFVTESTKRFVLGSLTIEQIKEGLEKDKHLNKIKIPYNNMGSGGRWWWDDAPINIELLRELGESNSPSTHTCVAKACARNLVSENK